MNRLQSMLAAGLTTALSAAAIGAFASAQGIWGGETPAPAEPLAAIELQEWTGVATPEAAQPAAANAAATPMVIYKDLEPIVVTRQVFTTAPTAAPTTAAQPAPADPTPTATQPAPDATPMSPTPEPPVLVAAPEQPPTSFAAGTAPGFDDNGGDRSDDHEDDDWDDDDHDDEDDDDWEDDDRDDDHEDEDDDEDDDD